METELAKSIIAFVFSLLPMVVFVAVVFTRSGSPEKDSVIRNRKKEFIGVN